MNRVALGAAVLAFSALGAPAAYAQSMSVKSAEVSDGGAMKEEQVLNAFGCKGGNISPSLSWSGAPSGTKSLAITNYDPDAPTGSGWWHWVVFNIPAATTFDPEECRRRQGEAHACRRHPEPDRFRYQRLGRSVPAARRNVASLHLYGVRSGRRQAAGREG